ncbi:MAG: lysylphosphatidylglycerol synthase domain-containing protein [Gemmatimonadota bacterium]
MKTIRWLVGGFVAAAIGTAALAVGGGWESWQDLRVEAAGFDWRVRPWLLAGATAAAVAALLLTGRLWALLFHQAGGRVSTREAVGAWLGSNLGRYLPGKIWQLTGIAVYLRARGDSGAAGFGTSLALQAVILVTGTGVGVALAGRAAGDALDPRLSLALGVVLLATLHPRVIDRVIGLGARLLREPAPGGRLSGKTLAQAGAAGIVIWMLYGIGFWCLVHGLVPGSSLPPLAAAGIFAIAYVAGYVVLIAPGGLVVREGAMAALLVAATGIPLGAAAAVAAAARVWTTVAELIAFGIVVAGLRRGRETR